MSAGKPAELTLLLPGLCDRYPLLPAQARFPALEALLVCAQRRHHPPAGTDWILCRHFGIDCPPQSPPVAPLTRLLDGAGAEEGIWMRADPVHIAVGTGTAVLQPPALLNLRSQEAQGLIAELADLFADLDTELKAGASPERWYLRLSGSVQLQTQPLEQAIGRNLGSLRLQGADRATWNRVLSEVQMRLHLSPINQQRRRRGELPINGLWCWGAGRLPKPAATPAWDQVYSNAVLAEALARLHGISHQALPESFGAVRAGAGQRVLIAWSAEGYGTDRSAERERLNFLHALERGWCIALKRALLRAQLRSLRLIVPPVLEFRLSPSVLWRFWRRPRPLEEYLGGYLFQEGPG